MISEEQTIKADEYGKEERCPKCNGLLFKGQAKNIEIKCRKCGKVSVIKN